MCHLTASLSHLHAGSIANILFEDLLVEGLAAEVTPGPQNAG